MVLTTARCVLSFKEPFWYLDWRQEMTYLLGAMDAISALVKVLAEWSNGAVSSDTYMEAIKQSMKSQVMMVVQMRPAVPLQG